MESVPVYIQLTTLPALNERERLSTTIKVDFSKNGSSRLDFLREVEQLIRAEAARHNERFKQQHTP